jgi:hypothetical protein
MAEKELKKPVMDVERPGTTPASATSRPIIVSRGPAIKDPMVNEAKPETEEPKDAPPALPTKKKTIQPLSEQPKDVAVPSDAEDEAKKESEEVDKPEAPAQPPVEPIGPDLADDEVNNKSENPAGISEIPEEDRKRQELTDKLVASKKYYVPIGAAGKKRTARNVGLLFVILAVIIGAALAIDAGLIQTDITLPFDLIK